MDFFAHFDYAAHYHPFSVESYYEPTQGIVQSWQNNVHNIFWKLLREVLSRQSSLSQDFADKHSLVDKVIPKFTHGKIFLSSKKQTRKSAPYI